MATRQGSNWLQPIVRVLQQLLFIAVVGLVVLAIVNQDYAIWVLSYIVSAVWGVLYAFLAPILAIIVVVWGISFFLGNVFKQKKDH